MARDNVKRPMVGRIPCKDCGEIAGLYKMKRGSRQDLLYKRCGCGCDQRTGDTVQKRWRTQMDVEPGYEYLKIQPETTEPEPEPARVEEKPTEPETTEKQTEKQPKKTGLLVMLGLVGAGLLAITKG